MVSFGLDQGQLGPSSDTTQLVEPTSGNTGLALCMVANARKIPLTVPISLKVPAEKRNALKLFGAEVLELEDDL